MHGDGDTAARDAARSLSAAERGALQSERDRLLPVAASIPALEAEADILRRRIAAIEHSVLWRATFPLRFARKLVVKRYWIAFRASRWLKDRWEA